MTRLVLIVGIIVGSLSVGHAQLTIRGMMRNARQAGICDILARQTAAATSLTAQDFLVRFWTEEAARERITLATLRTQCPAVIESYDRLWAISGTN